MEETKITHQHIDEYKDSLDIGTSAKGGGIKVYGNFLNKDEFNKKIDNAIEIRKYAQGKLGIEG